MSLFGHEDASREGESVTLYVCEKAQGDIFHS